METITNNVERNEFRAKLKAFETKVNAIKHYYTGEDESIQLKCGEEIAYINKKVQVNFCSLDAETNVHTILNVIMEENGQILPHYHDRVEVIFVIEGEIFDKKTGIITPENNLYIIPEGQIHHLVANKRSLLTMTWKPKYIDEKT